MSTAPSPARSRRAWRAGLRPDAAWLLPGLLCVVLGRWIHSEPGTALSRARRLAPGLVDDVGAVLASDSPTLANAWAISGDAIASLLVGIAVVAACVIGLSFVAAALLRRLGPIDGGGTSPGSGTSTALVGALAAAFVGVFVVRRAVAGGARAADASLAGLSELWIAALSSTLTTMGVAMIVLGALEGWRSAVRIRRLVTPTAAEAADEARGDGTRRR